MRPGRQRPRQQEDKGGDERHRDVTGQPSPGERDGDHREHGGHRPGDRLERRQQREPQRAAPARPGPPVRSLRRPEEQRRVRQPGQHQGRDHSAEPALLHGPGDHGQQPVGRRPPQARRDRPGHPAQEPVAARRRERHGEQEQDVDEQRGVTQQHGAGDRQRQQVRRGRSRRPAADVVVAREVAAPPVQRRVRRGQQRTAGQRARADQPAGRDQRRQHEHREHPGHRAGHQPRRPGAVGLLGPAGMARVGPVTGLERDGGDQVSDGVQAVPVGQPGGRQQVPHLPVRDGGGGPALAAAGDDPAGPQVHRRQPPELGGRLARRPDQHQPQRPDEAAEQQPDDPERQPARGPVDQQRVERGGPLRRRNAPVSGVRRTPRWAASTWKTTASGATSTGCPARAARQPRSTSLPKTGSRGSKPRASRTGRRTSIPAVLTASTSRTSSCWPWSYSPLSRPVSRRPVPLIVTPTSRRRRSEGHSRSLGPSTSAWGRSAATASSCSSASGAGAQSSWSSQTQSSWPVPAAGAAASAVVTASPKPLSGGACRHGTGAEPLTEQVGRAVGAAGVHGEHQVRSVRLGGDGVERSRQPATTVAADEHRGHRGRHGRPP